ncbi:MULTISPECIES: ABC transporter substrate-binding protein [unclassified Variovorax]|uniref:ABC transporter substrate-binding protein n=1 Tax=unclassified Variovorax TaxID=663243 RepID=UPI002575ECD0|nr:MULTISPECIES: ABC transporter substrate-binding protein [unclassified Variovorax]MDM0091042.1 ABC transporter substrate-binding protein [Variovorax sp. J22G40]MDM0148956.1 ABC transporter substrate-binding protein [Variovorax sp. J2P1-31]
MRLQTPFIARALLTTLLAGTAFAALAQDKVVLATNWRAQPGHGGFYQALADGTYKKFGLDVEIQQGGPQVNNRPMLPAGKIDFLMTGNLLMAFDNIKQKVPTVVVAAYFQKDPQAIIAHPGQGFEKFADLAKAKTVLLAKDGQISYWQWMKKAYGMRDEQVRPYNYSLSQFLADKQSVQQAYATSEPFAVEKQAGFKPVVLSLADAGWSTYGMVIETRQDLVKNKPDLVRRFVEATNIGHYNYLYGDRKAADAMIQKINPDISEDYIEKSIPVLRAHMDVGDAPTKGIGAISDARMKDFYDKTVEAGLYKPTDFNYKDAYTTQFVNKGTGLDIRKALVK